MHRGGDGGKKTLSTSDPGSQLRLLGTDKIERKSPKILDGMSEKKYIYITFCDVVCTFPSQYPNTSSAAKPVRRVVRSLSLGKGRG